MSARFEVLISGGGLAGLTFAALLAASERADRFGIRVVDAGQRPVFAAGDDIALRVSALSAGSGEVFRTLGVRDRVLARACAFRAMHVWDAARPAFGPDSLHFDAAEFAIAELGHIAENAVAREALLERLALAGVTVEYGRRLCDLEAGPRGCRVRFEDGETVAPDLVVGADGADSAVRRGADIAVTSWRYPQAAFVTHLAPEQPHGNCAWQRFLPEGPLALLPLEDGRVSLVWTTTPAQASSALDAAEAQLGERLSEASDGVLGRLSVAAPRASFPLRAQYASAYVRPGLALIGDAAHNIHPLAGQGANLGIADAAALAGVVTAAPAAGEHPGDFPVLRRYERGRKGANQAMLHFVDALNRLFASTSPPVTALRGAGMRLFNRSGPLRRRAVGFALGVGGRNRRTERVESES